MAIVAYDYPHHPHIAPTTAFERVTNTKATNRRIGRVGVTVCRIIVTLVVVADVGIAVGAVIRGDLACDEVGVVFAVLVDDEVDEVPHGRVEEDGAHHQVE